MSRATREQMESAYITASMAGSTNSNKCKQLRIEANDGEPISTEEFCDLMASACLVRATEGHSSGWIDIVQSEFRTIPSGFCSSGRVGIICPGNTVLNVDVEIDASILLKNFVSAGQLLALFAAALRSALGIEVEARITRERHTLLVTWVSWERKYKIKTMLSMPRGYEAYCAGVPLDDIVT